MSRREGIYKQIKVYIPVSVDIWLQQCTYNTYNV